MRNITLYYKVNYTKPAPTQLQVQWQFVHKHDSVSWTYKKDKQNAITHVRRFSCTPRTLSPEVGFLLKNALMLRKIWKWKLS